MAQDHGERESRPQNSPPFLPEYANEVSPLVSVREGAILQSWQETFGADESLSQILLDALPETIAVIDQVGTLRMVNQAWKRFAQANSRGQDADALALGVGVNYLQVCRRVHGLAAQEAVAALQGIERVLQGRQDRFTLEYSSHSITQQRWFRMDVTPLPQQRGAIITHHDVTDWKLTEEFQANVIHQRESEVLLRLVSHELKTPITTAQFALNLLAERVSQTGDEQAASRLYAIDTQLATLRKLVDDLLEKTALEAGTLLVRPELFAIADLVRETVDALSRTELSHTLLIEGQVHCQVYADRQRTGQILLNLLTNALKYSPPGKSVRVKVSTGADIVTLKVRDQGVGIPRDQQTRIFEQFVRLPTIEQTPPPGLGLGLYIAAELVKQQGGHIWVESTPGKGSIFAFTLPRHRPQP